MGKKKAAKAPSTPCPHCGKPNHPRTKVCKHCGKEIRKATPKKKAATKSKPQATSLTAALKAERATLQQRINKIDDLLDTY